MKTLTTDLAVIIPVKPGDLSWLKLLPDLTLLSPGSEIILVGSQPAPDLFDKQVHRTGIQGHTQWIQCSDPLPAQLNAGAKASTKPYLWFLLAHSRVRATALSALDQAIRARFFSIHFFDVQYLQDGPSSMGVNSLGLWIRGHILRIPTLIHGLCLPKQSFFSLGGFREDLESGSEQHFIMKAKAQGLKLRACGASLHVSAKKYLLEGWSKTSTQNFLQTQKQTLPAVMTYLRTKFQKNREEPLSN